MANPRERVYWKPPEGKPSLAHIVRKPVVTGVHGSRNKTLCGKTTPPWGSQVSEITYVTLTDDDDLPVRDCRMCPKIESRA